MPFADNRGLQTNDAEYRRNRPLVLQRDGFRCQIKSSKCTGVAEEVDHIRNFKSGGGHDLSNLQAVCKKCHADKTWRESYRQRMKIKAEAKHPDTRRKHPGYK